MKFDFNLNSFVEPPVGRVCFGAAGSQNLSEHFLLASVGVAPVVTRTVQANDEETTFDCIQRFKVRGIWKLPPKISLLKLTLFSTYGIPCSMTKK